MALVWYDNVLHKITDTFEIDYDRLHRDEDKPAIIYANVYKYWYKHGKLHRDRDLPAIVLNDDSKYWFKNGLKHRDGDLPADIYANGKRRWYKNDKNYFDMNLQKLYPPRTQSVRELRSFTILANPIV